MWNRSVVHSIFFVIYCLIEAISSFKLSKNGATFDSMKASSMSSADVKMFLKYAAIALVGPFGEMERQALVPEGNEKDIKILPNKKRVKRSQYSNAGIPDIIDIESYKMIRMYCTMLKNLWNASYFGGSQPLQPEMPYLIMADFRNKLRKLFSSTSDDPDD